MQYIFNVAHHDSIALVKYVVKASHFDYVLFGSIFDQCEKYLYNFYLIYLELILLHLRNFC